MASYGATGAGGWQTHVSGEGAGNGTPGARAVLFVSGIERGEDEAAHVLEVELGEFVSSDQVGKWIEFRLMGVREWIHAEHTIKSE